MRRILVRLLAPLFVCGAATTAEQPPMMEFLVSDGARLMQRWEASVYAKLWNDRVLESTRQTVAAALGGLESELKFAPRDLLAALRYTAIRITGFTEPSDPTAGKPEAIGELHADLGDFAKILFANMREKRSDLEFPQVAGAEEAVSYSFVGTGQKPQRMTLARFGSRISGALNGRTPVTPPTITPADADLTATVDFLAIMQQVAKQAPNDPEQQAALEIFTSLKQYFTPMTWDATLVPEGIRERVRQEVLYPGVKPVDRTLFARLPENTLMAFAHGYDSAQLWNVIEPAVLAAMKKDQPDITREQVIAVVEQQVADAGLQLTFAELTAGINGTVLIAITPGAPFPAVTIALPRSKAIDQIVRLAAAMQQVELPAENTSGPLAIPNVPLPVSMIVDRGYWVITSDPQVPTTWNAGGKGWSASPAMTLAFEKAGADAAMIGASDTAAVLRTAGGFLALVPFPDAKDKQTAAVLLARAAAAASTGYLVGSQRGKTWEVQARGLLGFGAIPAISAAIAIPNLLSARSAANDVAIVTALRSGVFPAQIQFQAGAYVDQDKDSLGEYGFLAELAGGAISGQPDSLKVALLPAEWNAPQPTVNGYHFACWLPDGKGGALGAGDGARTPDKAAAKAQSESFVVYAWPANGDGPVFALTQSGTVYSTSDVEVGPQGPAWNALFGDAGWDAEPTWAPHRRR